MLLRPLICLISMFMLVNIADAAPYAYVTNTGVGNSGINPSAIPPLYDTVSIVNLANGAVTAKNIINPYDATKAAHPFGVAISPNGRLVFVGNQVSKSITVIDGSTTDQNVIGTVKTSPKRPSGLAVNPAGSRLFVANDNDGTVTVYDITTSTPDVNGIITYPVVATVNVGTNPTGVVVVPSTMSPPYKVYVSNAGSSSVSVITTDALETSFIKSTDIAVDATPQGMAYNASLTTLYVACLSGYVTPIDVMFDGAGTSISLGANSYPIGVAVSNDGNYVYVSKNNEDQVAIITANDNQFYSVVDTGALSFPYGVSINPVTGDLVVARSYSYATGNNSAASYDALTNTLLASYTVGAHPQSFGSFVGPMMYAVTVSQPTNGSITPAGGTDTKVLVAAGTDQSFTIAPASACFALTDVTVDGGSVGAVSPYTFSAISADHTLTASMSRVGWNVIVNKTVSSCDGTVPVTACSNYNTSPVLSAVPNSGCKVIWTGCSSVSGNDCTVNVGNSGGADVTVTAAFSQAGGPTKLILAGSFNALVSGSYASMTANDTLSVTYDYIGIEAPNFNRSDVPLVVNLKGGATDITHTTYGSTPSTINTNNVALNIGGIGAQTTVNFENITIK